APRADLAQHRAGVALDLPARHPLGRARRDDLRLRGHVLFGRWRRPWRDFVRRLRLGRGIELLADRVRTDLRPHERASAIAVRSRSGVTGTSVMRTPVA